MLYKSKTCKECLHKSEEHKGPGVPNLNAPKIYACRESPPIIMYAIGRANDGTPMPVPISPSYPLVMDDLPACSKYTALVFDDAN